MLKSPVNSGETALQLIKESLDEELHTVAHVFVVFGASVCERHCNLINLINVSSI